MPDDTAPVAQPPDFGPSLEYFIARWEARAAECAQVARELDMLVTLQTAKATIFRECAEELRRHVEGKPVVQLPRRVNVRSQHLGSRPLAPTVAMPPANPPKGA